MRTQIEYMPCSTGEKAQPASLYHQSVDSPRRRIRRPNEQPVLFQSRKPDERYCDLTPSTARSDYSVIHQKSAFECYPYYTADLPTFQGSGVTDRNAGVIFRSSIGGIYSDEHARQDLTPQRRAAYRFSISDPMNVRSSVVESPTRQGRRSIPGHSVMPPTFHWNHTSSRRLSGFESLSTKLNSHTDEQSPRQENLKLPILKIPALASESDETTPRIAVRPQDCGMRGEQNCGGESLRSAKEYTVVRVPKQFLKRESSPAAISWSEPIVNAPTNRPVEAGSIPVRVLEVEPRPMRSFRNNLARSKRRKDSVLTCLSNTTKQRYDAKSSSESSISRPSYKAEKDPETLGNRRGPICGRRASVAAVGEEFKIGCPKEVVRKLLAGIKGSDGRNALRFDSDFELARDVTGSTRYEGGVDPEKNLTATERSRWRNWESDDDGSTSMEEDSPSMDHFSELYPRKSPMSSGVPILRQSSPKSVSGQHTGWTCSSHSWSSETCEMHTATEHSYSGTSSGRQRANKGVKFLAPKASVERSIAGGKHQRPLKSAIRYQVLRYRENRKPSIESSSGDSRRMNFFGQARSKSNDRPNLLIQKWKQSHMREWNHRLSVSEFRPLFEVSAGVQNITIRTILKPVFKLVKKITTVELLPVVSNLDVANLYNWQ